MLALLAEAAGSTGISVRGLKIGPHGLSLEAGYTLLGLPVEVRLTGRLTLSGGGLQAEVGEVFLNGAEAPPLVRQQLGRLAGELTAKFNRRVEICRLELGEGYLYLGGRYRPRQ